MEASRALQVWMMEFGPIFDGVAGVAVIGLMVLVFAGMAAADF